MKTWSKPQVTELDVFETRDISILKSGGGTDYLSKALADNGQPSVGSHVTVKII
jgi:hypothetical protein